MPADLARIACGEDRNTLAGHIDLSIFAEVAATLARHGERSATVVDGPCRVICVPDSKHPKRQVPTSRKSRARRRGTILIADTPEAIAALEKALEGDDVRIVTGSSVTAARRYLKSDLRLILCGVHFDSGRMFEFLRLAKAMPATATVPFVCVRAIGVLAKPLVPHGIEVAARELGAAAYVDHLHTQNTVGEARATKTLRQILIAACRS